MILRGTGVESRALTLSYIPGSLCKFLFWDSASLSYWTVQTGLEFAWASRGWDYRQVPLYPASILNSIQCVLAFKSPLGDNTRVQASDLNENCLPPPPAVLAMNFVPLFPSNKDRNDPWLSRLRELNKLKHTKPLDWHNGRTQ